MNQAMKQRLTGTLVLGCLALIFIPMLLDGEGIQPAATPAPIPPLPAFTDTDNVTPQRPGIIADDASRTTPRDEPDASSDSRDEHPTAGEAGVADASEVPARLPSGLPESWAVRLGVFGDQANAEKLMKQLVDAGYKAYSRRMDGSETARTGIFVGPVLSRTEANRLIAELADRFELNGLVVRFEIDAP